VQKSVLMKAKIHLLILAVLLLIVYGVNAQTPNSNWADASVGLNSTWIINQNVYGNMRMEYSTTFGMTGGLGYCHIANDKFAFKSSIGICTLGQKYNASQENEYATRTLKLTYLQIPLLFMRNMPLASDFTWVAIGPELLFLVGLKHEFKASSGYILESPDFLIPGNPKDKFKTFDMALNFSLNKMYQLKETNKLMFLFTVNTTIGLLDINAKEWQIPNLVGDYRSSHNFYIGIKTGLMYKLPKH